MSRIPRWTVAWWPTRPPQDGVPPYVWAVSYDTREEVEALCERLNAANPTHHHQVTEARDGR